MTKTNKTPAIFTLTGCDNWTDAARATYLDADLMIAWIESQNATVRDRLIQARQKRDTARNPGYRFRLTSEDTAETAKRLEAYCRELSKLAQPCRDHLLKCEAEHMAMDTTWAEWSDREDTMGFSYGDSTMLIGYR